MFGFISKKEHEKLIKLKQLEVNRLNKETLDLADQIKLFQLAESVQEKAKKELEEKNENLKNEYNNVCIRESELKDKLTFHKATALKMETNSELGGEALELLAKLIKNYDFAKGDRTVAKAVKLIEKKNEIEIDEMEADIDKLLNESREYMQKYERIKVEIDGGLFDDQIAEKTAELEKKEAKLNQKETELEEKEKELEESLNKTSGVSTPLLVKAFKEQLEKSGNQSLRGICAIKKKGKKKVETVEIKSRSHAEELLEKFESGELELVG